MFTKKEFQENLRMAVKLNIPDLVFKNINIVDVFQGECFIADVAINNGYIVGIGSYEGKVNINGSGRFICPTLIDAHTHIESSLLTPKEYSKVSIVHGITTVIADPHEIANVFGVDGIKFMINSSKNLPLDFYFMLPSCVPSTSFETSGAHLTIKDLKPFYNQKNILGLAEVMDYCAVKNLDKEMIDKLYETLKFNKIIDGHCAGFNLGYINLYSVARIVTDHESISIEEMIDKIRRGFYLFMREGTAAKNLNILSKGVTLANSRRVCLCTDDKHIDEFIREGSIDNSIRMCIKNGIKPEIAIQMGTLNTAECYRLKDIGAIAPGYKANFIILDNLEEFKINSVYKEGNLIVNNDDIVIDIQGKERRKNNNSINFKEFNESDLAINLSNKSVLDCIKLIPNKLETKHLKIDINSLKLGNSNEFLADIKNDILKIAVIERHRASGNIGLGALNGFNLKRGAVGTTIAHDSHNIIICGTNDLDMVIVAKRLKEIGGGIVIANGGKILAEIALEIAGLMSERDVEDILKDMKELHEVVEEIFDNIDFNPFLTLSFLALPVIPDIKITDRGLFNSKDFSFI